MKVKLVQGLSYYDMGTGLSAKKGHPIDVDDKVGAELIASGDFAEATGDEKPAKAAGGTITTGSFNKPLTKMNTAELESYATERGIDLSGCKDKNEKIAAIKAAEEKAEESEADSDGATPGFEE